MSAPAGAYVLRDALVSFAATDYANQCTKAVLTPDQPSQTLRTMVPDGVSVDVDTAVWTLSLSGIQDYKSGQGLARFLTDNAGTSQTLTLTPRKGGPGASATVTVICKATPFGGDQGNFTTFDIELPCTGAPVWTDLP
ncbi:hypothetical protein GCM10009804_03150 [Kribbella hippodromi]|uniref:Uncharacterized protein n=1 Tax=Kribbella hippodromi TaxID=434347 RepID=A0ABN2BZ71_9ACTN